MTLTQLHYFITISERGSFNKAAEALFVAQPSLTSSIKELERELGLILFHRSGKGVTLTRDGMDFLPYARQVYEQYEVLLEHFGEDVKRKKHFGVSAQHYSFAVKAFVESVKTFGSSRYDFSIRETTAREVISDVSSMKSELGIIYINDANRKVLKKLIAASSLEFHRLIKCNLYVYLAKTHPLADQKILSYSQLKDYPNLTFDQNNNDAMNLADDILSSSDYPLRITASDRATMLNLMVGLNGFTLCSGLATDELDGSNFKSIPFDPEKSHINHEMEIGYLTHKGMSLSQLAKIYLFELKKCFESFTLPPQ